MSIWVKPGATSTYQGIFNDTQQNPGSGFGISEMPSNTVNFSMFESDNSSASAQSDSSVSVGAWTHLEAVRQNGAAYLYVNGVQQPSITLQSPNLNSSDSLILGQVFGNVSQYNFIGSMNDAAISNVVRSADWIATEYINQRWPAGFISVCAEQNAVLSAPACASSVTSYPTVTSATPSIEAAGATVTISGVGFGQAQNNSLLFFNGVRAVVTSWSDTQIVATVPIDATTGPLSAYVGGVRSNSDVVFTVPSPLIGGVTLRAPGQSAPR